MKRSITLSTIALLAPLFAAPLAAQQVDGSQGSGTTATAPANDSTAKKPDAAKKASLVPQIVIQNYRPADQRGINVFEAPKADAIPFTGFKLSFGAAFAQQFQGITHSNQAAAKLVNGVDQNKLASLGNGFNNADANLFLNAQLADGIRVAMTTYASSRHHNETWVKDGYFLIDKSPIDNPILEKIMEYTTLRIGHFEVNYGDAHFRRSDNGQTMYNPFVGNLMLDAFTTEIGGEVYLRKSGWLAMVGATGGEVKGQVQSPEKRSASYIGKVGYDKQLTSDLRVRATGSFYAQDKSASNTLFSGDRAGSRYYSVLDPVGSSESTNAWSGNFRPGFSNSVHAYVFNPFIKYRGLELFGTVETATGKASAELRNRTTRQYAGEAIYRFADDKLYLGARQNYVYGHLAGLSAGDQEQTRSQLAAGWFVTPLVLFKGELVKQDYVNFPTTDIRSGGKFKGFMLEGVVAF